jgi:peptidoglycan hydrolase-like protein with peptidoglycan-binding domain
MKKFLRRRWLTIAIVIVIAAAAATAAFVLFGRDKSSSTHYLTSTATTGTVSNTVQADFTVGDANDAMTISLSGTGSSSSSNSNSSNAANTTAAASNGGSSIITVSALAGASAILTAESGVGESPAPSPSSTTVGAPTLTGFAPMRGPVGTTVILTGSGLSAPIAVSFNGRDAYFQVVSDTQVRAIVPARATSGPITLATANGTATSAASFTVTPTAKPTPRPTAKPGGNSSSRSTTPSGGSFTGQGTSGVTTTSSGGSTGSSSSSSSSSSLGVVTRVYVAAGARPRTLEHLLSVSGKPIYAFVSSTPLYKTLSTSLSSGSQRKNVASLQRALKAAGYFSGTVNGDFGSSTKTALEDWQGAHGLSETGTVTTSTFVWVPKGAAIESWNVGLGGTVSSSTALATVDFPRDLLVEAQVTQADLSSLKVGQTAACTIDGLTNGSFDAKITSISTQPASSSSSGSSSSTTEYTVDLQPNSLPSLARSGMTGSLSVTIAKRSNVLVVPTSAVSGSVSSSFVQVMQNGKPTYRQVTTGLSTSSLTQITSGLTAGEVVVTGTYSNSASSTTNSSNGLGGLGGLGGGGSFRRSGNGSGVNAFPAPGQ